MLCTFFWVIPGRQNFVRRRFGTPCLSHNHRQVHLHRKVILHRYPPIKMEQTVFRNVGIEMSDAWELPGRKRTTIRRGRKFEITLKSVTKLPLLQKHSRPILAYRYEACTIRKNCASRITEAEIRFMRLERVLYNGTTDERGNNGRTGDRNCVIICRLDNCRDHMKRMGG